MSGFLPLSYWLLTIISVFAYSIYVKCFRFLGQTERTLGPQSHKKKNGTITMGGLLFLTLPLIFTTYTKTTSMILFATLAFGFLGFIDDLCIVIFKKNDGLKASIKLLCEVAIAATIFFFYLQADNSTVLNIFSYNIDLKWFFGLLILGLLVSSGNAWNLMDGIDGLCSGCSLIFGFGLMIIAYNQKNYEILNLLILFHITLFIFWCFNLPKAFLFMGDVGSLGLGAFYAITAVYLQSILAYILMAGLFIFETISVILQVSYFKRTKGKRLFKMAPFHHHLEACGFKELHIDLLFYGIQLLLVVLALWLTL